MLRQVVPLLQCAPKAREAGYCSVWVPMRPRIAGGGPNMACDRRIGFNVTYCAAHVHSEVSPTCRWQ